MGEPLNNYEAVRSATAMMIDPSLFSLRRSKVTISTVGIVPRILQVHLFILTQHLFPCLTCVAWSMDHLRLHRQC